MLVNDERNSLVDDLDIVVVDANPLAVEGGSGDDSTSNVTVSITLPITITYPITISTYPLTVTLPLPFTITYAEEELVAD